MSVQVEVEDLAKPILERAASRAKLLWYRRKVSIGAMDLLDDSSPVRMSFYTELASRAPSYGLVLEGYRHGKFMFRK